MEALLKASAIMARVGNFTLGPLHVDLQAGSRLALVGPSGSGKTSLLKVLAGHLVPVGGSISYKGKSLSAEGRLLAGFSQIALLQADFAQLHFRSVSDSLKRALKRFTPERMATELFSLAEDFLLADLLDRQVESLSAGQGQRLLLALAFAEEAKFLMLDEPFSHQDPGTKQRLLFTIRNRVEKGSLAIMLSTHQIEDALMLTDGALIIDQGQVLFQASWQALYQNPDPRISALFGYTSMHKGRHVRLQANPTLQFERITFTVTRYTYLGNSWLLEGDSPSGNYRLVTVQPVSIGDQVEGYVDTSTSSLSTSSGTAATAV